MAISVAGRVSGVPRDGGVPQAPRLTLVRGRAMRPVTTGLMGCPAGRCGVRPLDLLKVVQLAAGEQCQFGSWPYRPVGSSVAGWFRGHGHHRDGWLAGQVDPGLITEGAQPVVAATGELAGHR